MKTVFYCFIHINPIHKNISSNNSGWKDVLHLALSLVTGAIFPAIPPPLIHARAVELGLPQPDVDVIMDTTEPLREGMAAPGVWLIGF